MSHRRDVTEPRVRLRRTKTSGSNAPRTYHVDRAHTNYLGFPWTVTASTIDVRTPDGRPLGRVRSERAARALVRGYRSVA